MIIRPLDDELFCITQTDHAAFAAEVLSLWREDSLPEHPRRRELLFAAREHDNGWRETDAAPRRNEEGRPHDFLDLPAEERRELWDRGVRRWVDSEPWASRLILRHGVELHRGRREPEWRTLLSAWEELDRELAERTGTGDGDVDRDYPWLSLADLLSLQLCRGETGRIEARRRRFDLGPEELRIDPFPLAGATTFTVRGRRLPDRSWPDETSLAIALARARWEERTIRIVPAGSRPR